MAQHVTSASFPTKNEHSDQMKTKEKMPKFTIATEERKSFQKFLHMQ